jgi:hypothetical protein
MWVSPRWTPVPPWIRHVLVLLPSGAGALHNYICGDVFGGVGACWCCGLVGVFNSGMPLYLDGDGFVSLPLAQPMWCFSSCFHLICATYLFPLLCCGKISFTLVEVGVCKKMVSPFYATFRCFCSSEFRKGAAISAYSCNK